MGHMGSLKASNQTVISAPLPIPHLTLASLYKDPGCPLPRGFSQNWGLALLS